MKRVYDRIGAGYVRHRCAEPRLVTAVADALALETPAALADIGAGTGNYSRALADLGFRLEAVEPSPVMRAQALHHPAVTWHEGVAENVPLRDGSVDGVICILASHHFSALETAVTEMVRICPEGPIVWFTLDPRLEELPWLGDYFPTVLERGLDVLPPLDDVCRLLEAHSGRRVTVIPWPVPHDLRDHFLAAGWRRPEMYLDAEVRAAISLFALAGQGELEEGLSQLQEDLARGDWKAKYGSVLERQAIDWGYRLVKVVSCADEAG